ncbi:Mut7-C ubiquitin/RNAse domain-containing protein [Yinghuangia soli]|uniref:Mut7-C ubiquitin/RNAse domain-containing protein n=1 Tax=Yinghuangia soli TaxID=2908204 RepID=A0AA41TZV8_9ACTN|nr:Mut7-C ubiquitin/RNAse domain-containing protein [Yinghuangia soli]MCF2525767.1 Mut7-C ubiquitin/RNAse domain-containing protein [Yinghuangia soli]
MPGTVAADHGPSASLTLTLADDLHLFLPPRLREGRVTAAVADDSTLGHLVESAGVPLPEVGRLVVDGAEAEVSYRPVGGETVEVFAVARPQQVPEPELRFLLDVHLGALARRMRLVGLDTAYHNDCDDPVLVEQANAERRVLLTQDRGLLRRRNLWFGAYVRGIRPDAQLDDLLRRFAPELAPWTRCTSCNGPLTVVSKESVAADVEPGTLAAFDNFARCGDCDRVYWHGSHGGHLDEIVETARRTVAAAN